MSDGPHRSLPLRKHWQDLAERAANQACPLDQVCEALPPALQKEFAEAPLAVVRDILGGGKQASLFQNERVEQLETARRTCRGSAAGTVLIDCAIEAAIQGQTGEVAFNSSLENALEAHTRSTLYSTEEHYQREASEDDAHFIRDRLNAVRQQCDFKAIASDLKSGDKTPGKSRRLTKRSDIDEGPPL